MKLLNLHHVSVPVSDLERSVRFYRDILGLRQIDRPSFSFGGAWFELADRELHLVMAEDPTWRIGKPVTDRDIHFAIRVESFRDALSQLDALGYRESEPEDSLTRIRVSPYPPTGYPQIFMLDPDRNIIEINAESAQA